MKEVIFYPKTATPECYPKQLYQDGFLFIFSTDVSLDISKCQLEECLKAWLLSQCCDYRKEVKVSSPPPKKSVCKEI